MIHRDLFRAPVAFAVFVACSLTAARAQDASPPLPPGVRDALAKMVAAQRSGDLDAYANTLASPVGPGFRIHADSATKVGEAKRHLRKTIADHFATPLADDPFAFAFDDTQLKATLQRLVNIRIDDAAPSGSNWKMNVTTTVAMPDGSTRDIPQGFIAVEYGADWKVQDLAAANRLASEKKGAEINWSIYAAFNVIADEVLAGKYSSADAALAAAKAKYDELANANAPSSAAREEYLAAYKSYLAEDFARSLAGFKSAAAQGVPHAAYMVAMHYSCGFNVKQDDAAAVEWLKKDVALHDPMAENFLGAMLLEGDGAPKDSAEGLRLLQRAADQDNAGACLNLGRAYLFGIGVPKNVNVGRDWYNRSAELGNGEAAYFMKWLGQAAGNRMFKDQNQANAFQQIALLRANALLAAQSGYREDGTWRAPNAQRAAELNAQADQLARENGLD